MFEHLTKTAVVDDSQTTGFEKVIAALGINAYFLITPLLVVVFVRANPTLDALLRGFLLWFSGLIATVRILVRIARAFSPVGTSGFLCLVIVIRWHMRSGLMQILRQEFSGVH